MTLLEAIQNLDQLDDDCTIYAAKPWSPTSAAAVVAEPEDGGLSPDAQRLSLARFLEVFIASEFLDGWRESLGRDLTPEETCERLIRYAIDDA